MPKNLNIMAKAGFFLKEPKSDLPTPINLIFQFAYKEFISTEKTKYRFLKYGTGEKILPSLWNKEKQRVKETGKFPEYPEFNSRLDNIESAVKTAYRKILNDKKVATPELLKSELNKILNISIQPRFRLIEFIEDFINNSNRRYNTKKHYRTTFNHLKKFQKERNKKIDFENIDMDFYNDFVRYFYSINATTNTIGGHIKNLKVFLNEATERGINSNTEYKSSKFKTIDENVENIYLNDSELKVLQGLDLSKNQRLGKVRDLFLVGCYTGLRFSDFSEIRPENVLKKTEGYTIRIKTRKTDELVEIPLMPVVIDILKRHEYDIPRTISNQKMNNYLKELAKLAEMNDVVVITKTIGGKRTEIIKKKHELVTTHTARRSFATNMFRNDVPSISIMKITGHKTEKSFLKYIKISQEENAVNLLNHPYFKQTANS